MIASYRFCLKFDSSRVTDVIRQSVRSAMHDLTFFLFRANVRWFALTAAAGDCVLMAELLQGLSEVGRLKAVGIWKSPRQSIWNGILPWCETYLAAAVTQVGFVHCEARCE